MTTPTIKILLIWPDSLNEVLGWGSLGAVAEPLALEYLAAAVTSLGHEVRILDLRLHPQALDSQLLAFQPDLVGVTAYSMHVRRALSVCQRAKALLPNCRTIVGGHHATFLPEDFFSPAVDWVVSGEGCAALSQISQALAQNRTPDAEPGLWTRTESGGYERPMAPIANSKHLLDSLPQPRRDLVPADRPRYFIDWMRPVAMLRTALGCPYRCTFCSIWKAVDGRYLVRSAEGVVKELQGIEEDWVFMVDDEAFINERRMLELAAAIQHSGIRKRYFTYCRIDTLLKNRRAVAAWREIGLERLFIGIDAISAEELDNYNKKCAIDQIEEGLSLAKSMGIEVFAQFVVHPNYTRHMFKRLIRFIEHHEVKYPSFTVLTPLPGTELLADFSRVTQMQDHGRPNWDLFDCQNAVTATTLPLAEFKAEYRNLYKVFKGAYSQYREHSHRVSETALGQMQGSVIGAQLELKPIR